jgi:hypothetical protein
VLEYRCEVFDTERRPVEYVVSFNHPQRVAFMTEDGAS